MAHIHAARNDLAGKLAQTVQSRHRRIPILFFGILLALCVCGFLFMLGHFDLGVTIRSAVSDFLYGTAEKLMDLQPDITFFEARWGRTFFAVLFDMGIFAFLMLLKLVLYLFLWAVAMLAPSLVRIGLYTLPLTLAIYCLYTILSRLFGWEPASRRSNTEDILRSGLEGEHKALSLLKSMGDDCHIFTNLRIPYDGGESETDLIVVTPGGITIVEVKNHKGTITGDASDDQLTQHKPRRSGTPEIKTFHNPIRQVGTHAYRLAGYLRTHGVHSFVRTCVFFVNGDVNLRLTDRNSVIARKCPLFPLSDVRNLRSYLLNSGTTLSAREYRRTLQLLEDLVAVGLAQMPGIQNPNQEV